MKTRTTLGASALLFSLAAAGSALQDSKENQDPKPHDPKSPSQAQKSVPGKTRDTCFVHEKKDVIGAGVKNASGEKLGDIEEVVLDKNTGAIAYAVLSFGGVLGMGDKLFAVPWDMFTPVHESDGDGKVKDDEAHFVLGVDKEQLKQSPGFPKDNWPDMDSEWAQSIQGFYRKDGDTGAGAGRMISDTTKLHLLKLKDVDGCDVDTSDGSDAGEIKDVAIDLNQGRVAYVVLASGGVLGFGTDKYAIPFEALTFAVDKDKDLECKLKIPKAKFERAPAFDSFDKASDQAYVERLYTYYEYPFYWTGEPHVTPQ
jgi:sporulation protein YlmC with PRC-barrel domain